MDSYGRVSRLPVTDLGRHLLRWSRASLFVVVPTGFLMFMTNATKLAENPVFRLKLILIALAAVNALVYHLRASKSAGRGDVDAPSLLAAKLSAVVSLAAWAGVISCGRLIAFF